MRTIGFGVVLNATASGSVEERAGSVIGIGVGVSEGSFATGAVCIDEKSASIAIEGVVITVFVVRLVCKKGARGSDGVVSKSRMMGRKKKK